MKNELVIFHYHLFPGGVTNVVMLSVRSLLANFPEIERIRLVCGSEHHLQSVHHHLAGLASEAGDRVSIEVLPELYYIGRDAAPGDSGVPETATLKRTLSDHFGGALWWVHNYHLGKNPVFTQALLEIARDSPEQRMILHIHDFPECARYGNLALLDRFTTLPLYPTSPNVRYAVINSRDHSLLTQAGLRPGQCFLLDNPVPEDTIPEVDPPEVRSRLDEAFAGNFPAYTPGAPLLFYPVRTIRRKNVLEAGLIALLAEGPANLIVTLPGLSEHEVPYSALVAEGFASGLIPGMWGIGSHLGEAQIGFQDLALSSDCVVSSSVQEGFGYLFIDGRRWGKPILARYLDVLDGITETVDGESAYFYRDMLVPLDGEVRRRTLAAYRRRAEEIRPFLPNGGSDALVSAIERSFGGDTVDFSYLAVDDQREILARAAADAFRSELATLNGPVLAALTRLMSRPTADIGDRIRSRFSLSSFASTVRSIIDSFESPADGPAGGPEHNTPAARQKGDDIHANLRNAFGSLPYIRLLYE